MSRARADGIARIVACAVAVGALVMSAAVQAQSRPPAGRGGATATKGGGRMAPAAERDLNVASGGDEEEREARRAPAGPPPENLEERLYLRDRPDSLGTAAREHADATIQRMLASREQLVLTRRNEAVRLLEEFVRVEPDGAPEMADALMRLAELKWEVARADYLIAFAAWQAVPEANRSAAPPAADYQVSIGLYDRILQTHREFGRYDFVLYLKAYLLVDSGKLEEALVLYRQILAEFPQSRFVPDAHMALAETFFNGTFDYPAAFAEYELVMQHRDSELYDIALFKSAWCLWRMNRSRDAAQRFRQVLDLAQQTRGLSGAQVRRRQELQDEALNYLIQVFTEDESNTAADVFRFLQEIGGERYAKTVLARLSETFFDQARYDRGIEAYKMLLQMDPTNEKAPEWQAAIARGYGALDDHTNTIESMRLLATNYGPGTTWATQQGDPETIARARRLGERTVRRQALKYHEQAQRDRQQPKYERAAGLYRIYLANYPDAPTANDIRFYLAEILFHRLEQYQEAGQQYLLAARGNPRGQYTRDALYNAIGAFEHVREVEIAACRSGGTRPTSTPAPTPPNGRGATPAGPGGAAPAAATGNARAACGGESDNDLKFGEAIELYVQLFPRDPDLPEILFRQGKLYYDNQIFDPAVRLWGQLLEKYPNSEYATTAGDLILDSFNRAQDYGNIERWARRLKAAPSFQAASAQTRLDGLILQSVFKLGEQLALRGDHAGAANAYYRAAEEFPRDARARQAYFNAGVERQRAGDLAGAAEAYDRLIERHPGTTEGALGAWTAAQMYESIAQFRDAARYYEQYAEKFPQGEKAQDALYNAVLLRVTAGDDEEAVTAGQAFLQRYPRVEAADDVSFFVGRAHEAGERWTEAANTYREYVRRTRNNDRKVEAQTRLGQVLLRAENAREADRAFDAAVQLGRRNQSSLNQGLYYAAQARYLQGDNVLREFEALRIEGDVAGLRQRLERKGQLLQRAAAVYADVVQFGVAEWVTAALFQVGHIYENFAESLRGAPVPEGLNEEETQSYQDQISMFVVPIEERALEAYEGGYAKAVELRIYNSWTAKLREALTRLNDVQYPPLREIGGEIVLGTPLPLPAPLDGLRRGAETSGPAIAPAPGAPAIMPAGETTTGAAATPGGAMTTPTGNAPTETQLGPATPAPTPAARPRRPRRGGRR